MEQVTSINNLEKLLLRLKSSEEPQTFKRVLENLMVHCINLEVNQKEVSETQLEKSIQAMKNIEKITLYLFSEYNNVLRQHDKDLMEKAMRICALASEKLGDYLNNVSEEKLLSLNSYQITLKQLKSYWRAAVAYTISKNPPNAFVVAKKYSNILEQALLANKLSNDMRDIYRFSYYLLSRHFINDIQTQIDDKNLVEVFTHLRSFMLSGSYPNAERANTALHEYIESKLAEYQTDAVWHLKYLASCIETIINNSVWTNLSDIFSSTYLQQLIKSKPSVLELWPNQLDVINNPEGFLRNNNIKRTMINFPTSGGKSLLAEFAVVKELENDITKKCFYIVPTNALVYEVTKRFRERFRRLGYKVSSSISGYEPDFVFGSYTEDNVIVTTPEKLDTIIRKNFSDGVLDSTSLIIFDEFHKIQDRERGWLIEGSISFLISHEIYSNIKLLLLSAIIDNGSSVMEWVDGEEKCSSHIPNDWRPTIKLKGIANYDYEKKGGRWITVSQQDNEYIEGYKSYKATARINYKLGDSIRSLPLFQFARHHYISNNKLARTVNIKSENFIMGVAQKLKNLGGSLIFFHTKDDCEKFVRNYEPLFPERMKISPELEYLIKYIEKRLGSEHLLTVGINKGIVYHHGSLPIDIRESLEDYYLKGFIKIMVCTTTLVEGVNFPIQNFIHTGRTYEGQQTLSSGDFKNIAGRAGRAYQSTFGQIIYINFYKNIIEEHLNYEDYSNNVSSSLVNDDELFAALDKLEELEGEMQTTQLLELTSQPFAKSLLLFYNTFSTHDEDIDSILHKTLFSYQNKDGKVEKLTTFTKKLYYFFDTQTPIDLRKIQESGLSVVSYRIVQQLSLKVIENYSRLNGVIASVSGLIDPILYTQILSLKESKRFIVKRSTAASSEVEVDDYGIFIDWIETGKSLKELSEEYFQNVEETYRMTRVVEYVRDMFEFKLPWVIGTMCSVVMETTGNNQIFMFLPLYIKYGVNHSVEVNLFKLGFNSRETVKGVSKHLIENTRYRSLDELRDFLKEVEPLLFLDDSTESNITPLEIRKLVSLTNNYRDITNVFREYGSVDFNIAGTKYYLSEYLEKEQILKELEEEVQLELRVEKNNFYDENAVEILYQGYKLGYVPRQYNEEVSYYLDLSYKYSLNVVGVNIKGRSQYIEVGVRLYFEL
ncbi:hypothetical protein YDYSG_04410 [Paenibacillus tyrfis]|uniref:DEAD/DEAH box helicase n=1 Tax=Paenibacillus tyrfis TaxID=1501230 RepID=UPI0024924F19|nr:DEAD/DEAH box helicase [Paenibacillus tyrfis]GLI04411.1 hypothetical protein YDYSG_04410 [Paenibacillus tyrfis]